MSEFLISDPVERQRRAKDKEEWCLDFLKEEIYSSTKILAYQMCVGERAARITLNRMVKKGLLVKDEVRFMEGRALPLWGITMTGLMEVSDSDDVAKMKLRYHTPGRVSPLTIAHTLDIQKYRCHCEFNLDYEDWVPTRLLPALNKRRGDASRWAVYPDAVANAPRKKEGQYFRLAIEVERTRKSPQRYVQIIKGHFSNVEEGRYNHVRYVCLTQRMADNLKALFLRIIKEKKLFIRLDDHKYSPDQSASLFSFSSLESID